MNIIITISLLFVLPLCLGLLFYDRNEGRLLIVAKGYLIQWAVFFVTSIPCILFRKSLSLVLKIYIPAVAIIALFSVFLFGYRAYVFRKREKAPFFFAGPQPLGRSELIYLAIFVGIVLFQLYKTIFYAFTDGDDAYYIAMANSINVSDEMYTKDAYTGWYTTINYRYALAPFPVWIAGVSRLTGIHVSTMSHILLNVILITITYVIYNEIAKRMFEENKEKRYMFLILFAVFAMFSNVSQSMPETFMLTRARQGKEILSNIIIPFLFYCFFTKVDNEKLRLHFGDWCLWIVVVLAGALSSVFSNMLVIIALGIIFLYSLYRKAELRSKLYIATAAIPAVLVILMYWRLG